MLIGAGTILNGENESTGREEAGATFIGITGGLIQTRLKHAKRWALILSGWTTQVQWKLH